MIANPPTSAAPLAAIAPTSGGHGADHRHAPVHDHAHHSGGAHVHGHGHGHLHVHAPTPAALPRPGWSLVRASLVERLALAGGISGVIWLGVAWALRPIG